MLNGASYIHLKHFALACLMLEGFGVSYILFKHLTITSLMLGGYGLSYMLVKHLVFRSIFVFFLQIPCLSFKQVKYLTIEEKSLVPPAASYVLILVLAHRKARSLRDLAKTLSNIQCHCLYV